MLIKLFRVEKSFRKKFIDNGAIDIQVGYAGGHQDNADYRQVCSGSTGHAEVVQIKFDPSRLPYETLVDFFYRMHDPTTLNSQGADHGTQYRSAIFYHDNEQKAIAESVTKVKLYSV
jgi:peptide-methionine (S)-S-oxide reductase